jgi:hypothetical protein
MWMEAVEEDQVRPLRERLRDPQPGIRAEGRHGASQ